ncbi:MAG: hypothetical protein AB2L12_13995 [Smithellaceae bacterium]|nr:MAG: hypothetical protein BWX92_02972 [Deltaproteobacteria bacterium ADurb.Bin135]
MQDHLNRITGVTEKERKRLFSWIASLPEEKIVEIFQNSVKKSFQLKEIHPNIPGRVNKYCAFVLASRNAGWDAINGKGYRVAEMRQFDDFSCLRKASAAALIKKGRIPVLRRKIFAYWGEVKELKDEGMGFRPITDYLSKTRKLSVSATYLAKLWKEVEANG